MVLGPRPTQRGEERTGFDPRWLSNCEDRKSMEDVMIVPIKTPQLSWPLTSEHLAGTPSNGGSPGSSEAQTMSSERPPRGEDLACLVRGRPSSPSPRPVEEDSSPDPDVSSFMMLPRVFLASAFGENLGEVLSKSIEHFFGREVLVPETPLLVAETPVLVPETPVLVPETPILVPETPMLRGGGL